MQDFAVPRQLSVEEIEDTIRDFASAARNAIDAGFDRVELNGANGYLRHQLLSTNANQRVDAWGWSPENRARLIVEATRAGGRGNRSRQESGAPEFTASLRRGWDGVFMLNPATPGSRTGPNQLALLENGSTWSFGQLFISNPDLPARLSTGAALRDPDMLLDEHHCW